MQIFRNKTFLATGAYTLLNLMPLAVNFILLPVYMVLFRKPEQDYAILSMIGVLQTFLVIGINFGLDNAFPKYFLSSTSVNRDSFLQVTVLQVIINAAILLVLYTIGGSFLFTVMWDNKVGFREFGPLIFISAFFSVCNTILFQYYRATENIKGALLTTAIPFLFYSAGGILWMLLDVPDAYHCALGRTVFLSVSSLPFLIHIIIKKGLSWNYTMAKMLLIYGAWLCLNSVMEVASTSMDKIILNRVVPGALEIVGVYFLAYTVVTVANFMLTGYINAITPRLYPALSSGSEEVQPMIHNAAATINMMAILINVLLYIAIEPIVYFYSFPNREVFKDVFILLLLINFLRMYGAPLLIAVYYYGKTIYMPVASAMFLVLSALLNGWFISSYGIRMAPVATALALIPSLFLYAWVNRKTASYSIDFRRTHILMFAVSAVIACKYFLPEAIVLSAAETGIVYNLLTGVGLFVLTFILYAEEVKNYSQLISLPRRK